MTCCFTKITNRDRTFKVASGCRRITTSTYGIALKGPQLLTARQRAKEFGQTFHRSLDFFCSPDQPVTEAAQSENYHYVYEQCSKV